MKNKHILLSTMLLLLLISFGSASLSYKINNTVVFYIDNDGNENISGTYYGDSSVGSLKPGSVNTTNIMDGTITDADINDTTNLTLGQRIVFAFGGFIQNIVAGRVDIGDLLNVTRGLIVNDGALYVSSVNDMVGIGTITPSHELNVVGDINVTGNYYIKGDRGFTGTCVNITYSSGLAITCND